jgi:hypothetical protein
LVCFFVLFQDKPVGWQLNYLISNCRAVLSSVLTVSKKHTHTHTHSLSLTTNQQTYPLNWVVGTNSILIPLPPFLTHAWMGQIWAPLPRISCKKYASLLETEGVRERERERERERSTGTNKLTRFSPLQAALWHRPFFTSSIATVIPARTHCSNSYPLLIFYF